jgi:hypothetical protein
MGTVINSLRQPRRSARGPEVVLRGLHQSRSRPPIAAPGTFRRRCVSNRPRSLLWQRQFALVVGKRPKSI